MKFFRSKHGNKKTIVDGIKFDSKLEASRYMELRMLQRAGEISELMIHVPFQLRCGDLPILIRSDRYKNGRKAVYEADFVYLDCRTMKTVIEDTKGFRTPEYKLKKAIMEAMGHTINEITTPKRQMRGVRLQEQQL